MKNYQYREQHYVVNAYPDRQLILVRGQGAYLYDEQNNRYLDMMSNYGVNIFGYNHPTVTNTLTKQLKKLTNLHGSFNNDVRARAAYELVQRCGGDLTQVYFSNSGAEAIEAALKFTALATGKKKIIACKNSYHGKTLGALSVTSGDKYRKPFEPFTWNVIFIKYDDASSLEKAIDKDTAAFIVEPVQGEGGILVPSKNYLKKIKSICKKHDIILIFDEIQSGIGRTGKFLACDWEAITPDILCLGKGIAGGLPIGATLVNEKVASKIEKNIHTSTFGGNPLACAGILAVLSLLDKKRLNYIRKISNYFINQLKKIKSEFIKDIRGKGLMIGIEVPNDKRNIILKRLQQEKILTIPAGENVVRFLPPYIINKKQIDFTIEKLNQVLNSIYV